MNKKRGSKKNTFFSVFFGTISYLVLGGMLLYKQAEIKKSVLKKLVIVVLFRTGSVKK